MSRAAVNRILAEIRRAVPAISGLQVGARGQVVGHHYGANISTAFQPWRARAGEEIVAVEAYARSDSKHGEDLSPWQLFADVAVDNDLVNLDRLCRTVHALNHFAVAGADCLLVLNVDARLLRAVPARHGEFFGKVLTLLGVSPANIVIEIRTIHQFDLSRLRQIVASYRKNGFAVAVNAEDAIHALSLAQLLAPEILMLDAIGYTPDQLRRYVAALVGHGVKIAVKRIETAEQAAALRAAGADWVQGYHFDQSSTRVADEAIAEETRLASTTHAKARFT